MILSDVVVLVYVLSVIGLGLSWARDDRRATRAAGAFLMTSGACVGLAGLTEVLARLVNVAGGAVSLGSGSAEPLAWGLLAAAVAAVMRLHEARGRRLRS